MKIKSFEFNPLGENTYILYNDHQQCVIIDAGNYNSDEDNMLFNFLEKNDLTPLMILDTHGHIDHILGNASIVKRYGIPLAAHPAGKIYYDRTWVYAGAFGLDFQKDSTVYPTIDLFDNQNLKIGDDILKVIETPGHAQGSVCFYDEKEGFVLTGDTLFWRSIGRTDLPGGDYSQLENSLREKLYQLPDETICYTGHGPATTIGDEKRFNPFITSF